MERPGDDGDGVDVDSDGGGDPGEPDAAQDDGPDGGGDPDDICATWDPAVPFEPCDIPVEERGGPLILDQLGLHFYNTDDGTLTHAQAGEIENTSRVVDGIRLVSAERIEIRPGATLRGEGSLPLVLASWSTIDVAHDAENGTNGVVDGSSTINLGGGDGADPGACAVGAGIDGNVSTLGGGGAGGGGFTGQGGQGGSGGSSQPGGAGGQVSPGTAAPRGGCPGGDGGATSQSGDPAPGGSGGGAVALSARLSIAIAGRVHAGGAGGEGGNLEAGGGGGGSGGFVWIDAPAVTLAATSILAANGGGGGEGSDSDAGGGNGRNALNDGVEATGGRSGGNDGGDGGDGSSLAAPADSGAGGTLASGGGGGGGGPGLIRLDGDIDNQAALITPPPE
ncbi:MAG TPA: hypothetical protein VNO33_01080 [Kofleriaceae bacterium]|nr:hypothetical protein [Kofleriaceae bacterium]